jgi:hypothetical protein
LADVNSNININFNTAAALAQLRSLQAGLSKFHQSLAEGNLAASNAQKGLNAQLLQSIGATGKFSASQVKVAGSTLAFTSALEKNKLSLLQYYKFTMAAATANTRVLGKAFAAEREIINRARRDRVKALQAQYIQMNKSNSGFMDSIRVMPKSLAMASGKFTELGTRIQYAAQRQQFLNQLLKQGSTQLLNFGKNTQWAGRQLMVGLTMPLALFGGMAARTFRELEAEIVKFRRVYGDAFTNDAETEVAISNIRALANEYVKYGISVTKTVEMAATAAAAGFSGSALNTQVETATKLAILGQVEQQQALETTISLQSAFGLSSEELSKKIDFLNAVENQTLLSIEDLTIAIPKAAPVIKQLGGNVEDLAFFLTAMKEGGINASEGANALKSGLASLINPSEKASKMLAGLGINISGIVENNSGDIKATVVGFARALDTLDPLNRAKAIEQMFGKFQFARLSTLFQNVTKDGSQASRAFDLAGKSVEELAILSEREMKKIEESVGVKFQAAVEKFKQDIMPIGKAFLEALTPVVKFFGSIFEKFNSLSDGTKKIVAIIVATVAGIGPVILMTFGLLANGIANVIKFFAMLRGGISKLNGQTSVMGAGFNYMTQEQIENAASSQQLHQTHTRLIEVFNVEKISVNALTASYNSLTTQMRSMASQNPALFAGGAKGASRAVSKLPPVRKYKDGVLTVPGPKGAGDIQPAMLSPGEAVIPTKITDKYRGLISAMFQDKVPGFMAGRIPKGITYRSEHPMKQSGAKFVGMPKSAAEASQSRQIREKISQSVKNGRFGSTAPTDFGTLLQSFSGRSFPASGVGGIYRKPNGQVVVVKPTLDEKTALAEIRATQIAREVHGLVSPKQNIKTMIDPGDPTGQRKFIVIESPYDPRFATMSGKFSKSDMVKQLVASTLRGDKDLQRSNLSGNVLTDPGASGVFDRASGFRDFSKAMPSMEQQGMINLLGVKGGARKFFAQETSGIAAKMSPQEYDAAIKAEINKAIPRLKKVIKSFDLTPEEQVIYNNMFGRLKDGAKTDWSKLQPVHARAGDGVVRAMAGIDPVASNSLIEDQLRKFSLPAGTQNNALIDDLKRNVTGEFGKSLENLDPQRRAVVQAAWSGGKALVPPSGEERSFNRPRQTSFLNEIQKMTAIMVDGETKYVHQKDLESFRADPTGRARYARTAKEVTDSMLYRMGAKERAGSYVANGGFSGRFAAPSHFETDLRSTGKQAGGGLSVLSNVVRPEAKKLLEAYNQKLGNALNSNAAREMKSLGFSDKQILKKLSPELSHIVGNTGIGGRDSQKFKTGYAQYDSNALNRYIGKGSDRFNQILNWNSKSSNALGLPQALIPEYKKAAEFMATGLHPVTPEERALVAKAAELEEKAFAHKSQGNKMPGVKLGSDVRNAKAVRAILGDSSITPSRPINLAATNPDSVLVKPGEFKLDRKTGTLTKLTTTNTSAKPAGTEASSGSLRDNRLTTERPGQSILTASQARRFAVARGIRVLPGRDKGTPGLTNPTVRQGQVAVDLRNKGYSQAEIDKILRKIAKQEIKVKETQVQGAGKAARVEAARQKEQAVIQKQQTESARKRFAEGQRRQELNRQQALNYDAAVKEGQKRGLKEQKQTQRAQTKQNRMARQEKVGKFSGGASMALGTAGMGLMMAGQQNAGMAVMGASAVAGMAPMLTNGYVAAGVAVVALTASLFILDKMAKKAAEAQSKLVDSTYSTTEKMKTIGGLTGKVGASEIMSRKRSGSVSDRYTTGFERGKQQFGSTFLQNEVGKDVMSTFTENMKSGTDVAASQMAIQLGGYISDGVMTAEQAHSVASQIGINLNNQSLTSKISGQLLELVGPGGKDLLTNPLEVRVKLIGAQTELSQQASDEFKKMMDGENSALNAQNVLGTLGTNTPGGYITQEIMKGTATGKGFNFEEAFTQTDAERMSASMAASGTQNLEFNQAQIDSLDVQYDKELKILEAKKAATTDAKKSKDIGIEIAALDKKRLEGIKTLRQGNKDILKNQIDNFNVAKLRAATEAAFFDSLNEQVKAKAEATGQGTFVDSFLNAAADLKSKELEVKIKTIVGSGQMPTNTAVSLLNTFAGKEKQFDKFLNITARTKDPGKVAELINSLEKIKGGTDILLDIAAKNPEEADRLMATIALMQKMAGKELNIEAFFEEEDAMARLKALQVELAAIENIKNPITKEAIALINTDGNSETQDMGALLALWDQWENLDDETKKTTIQEYITLLRTISEGQLDAEIKKRVAAAGGAGVVADFYGTEAGRNSAKSSLAAELTMQAVKQAQLSKNASLNNGPKDGGSKNNSLAFLDSLAMRLKQVRDNAFNAMKPVESLLAAFRDKKTQQGAFKLFDGIQNRLLKMNVGQDLRDAVDSMSAEDFSKIAALKDKKALFTFAKGKGKSKDTITGLTEFGRAVDRGYKEKALGDFNLANETTIKNIQDQTKAYNMLIGSGLTAAEALSVVSDQGQAAAIAGGAIKKSDPEWKKYVKNIKTASTELERLAVLNKAIRANEDFKMYKEMPKLVTQMKDLGYSTDQIDAVLGDPELAKFLIEDLKDGKVDAENIADYLNSIEATKIIDIQVKLNEGDLAGAAEQGRQLVDELFAAQEGLIRTGANAITIKGNEKTIADLENKIAPFQRSIELLNDELQDGQRAIEENYSRPIEKLNEEVSDLNRELETSPLFGDRLIQKIQDENSSLSNDLTIISNAAEEVNKKYDDQAEALQKVSDINKDIIEQQNQQIDLADAITSGDISSAARAVQEIRAGNAERFASGQANALQQARENALGSLVGPQSGLNQEQINEKQYENSQKIYALENNVLRLDIISKIQGKQDDIYNLEEKREDKLISIRDIEDSIYRIQEFSIEPLQERIDKLVYSNTQLQAIINKELESIEVLGKTRAAWDTINARIDYYAAAQAAAEGTAPLAGLLEAASKLDGIWKDILLKMAQYSTVKNLPGGNEEGSNESSTEKASAAATEEAADAAAAALDAANAAAESADAATTAAIAAADAIAAANAGAGVTFNPYQNKDSNYNIKAAAKAAADAAAALAPSKSRGGSSGRFAMQYESNGGIIKPNYFAAGGIIPMPRRESAPTQRMNMGGMVSYIAEGGMFSPKGTDTVPAMLTPGEYVLRKDAVKKYGVDNLNKLNAQNFADGGQVGGAPHNMGMSNFGSRVKPLPSMSASTPEAAEKGEKAMAVWYAKNGYEFVDGGWRKKVTAWNALTSRKEWLGIAHNVARSWGAEDNNSILGSKMKNFLDTLVFGSSADEATAKGTALHLGLMFAPIGTVGKALKLDKLGTRVLSKVSGALPAWAQPSLLSDKLREGVLAMSGKLAGLGRKAPSILPKIAETTPQGLINKSNKQANDIIRSIYKRKDIESDGNMFPTYTLGNQEKKFAFQGHNQDFSNLPGVEAVQTTPEGLLKAALKLDPKNKKNQLLLNSFKKNNMTEDTNKFLDNVIASISISKKGKQQTLEQADGFAMMLGHLTGNKNATSIIDYKTNKLYDIIEQKKALQTKTVLEQNSRIPGGSTGAENVTALHSTRHPVVRDKKGDIFLNPFGNYNPGSLDSVPRSTLHFTLEDVVQSHLFGTWNKENQKIVAKLSDLMDNNGLPYNLNPIDTYWTRNPGQALKISNASVISPYTDSALYAKELIKRGLIKAGQPAPLAVSDPRNKEVLQLIKNSYSPKDRTQIANMSEWGGLKADDLIGRESELLEEITLQFAKKQLGINTPSVKLGAHSLADNARQANINSLGKELNLSSEIHSNSITKMLEDASTRQKEGGLPYTNIYDSTEAMRMKARHGGLRTEPTSKRKGLSAMDTFNRLRIDRDMAFATGGLVPKYFAKGGYSVGTDTVPAMLTPGEFVMSKYAVDSYGVDNMKKMNSGELVGGSVYNYNLNLNVKSDAKPDDIARAVMVQIKSIDAQRIRGARF